MSENVYFKYVPNVFLAKCSQPHEKGEIIAVTTQRGKDNDSIVHNLVAQKDGFWYYSIVRADGFNVQEWAKRRAERLNKAAENSAKKSQDYYEKSQEGSEFLRLAEPIKIGHHSEKRHRALIERNFNRMGKSVEYSQKSNDQSRRAEYWESLAEGVMNLSMPESLDYYEIQLEKAKEYHAKLKSGEIPRQHSYSLAYANKEVKELEKKLKIAEQLWA